MSDTPTAGVHRLERPAWLAVLATFVVGDVLTTAAGLQLGAVEKSPVALALFHALGVVPAMLILKAATLAVLGSIWAVAPEEFRIAVPASLAVWGAAVAARNTYVVGVLLA
ncbi:hypothetical protein B4589_009485 [Halolamina sp. CBA1230]|uniref:hypothetical protein n=1 Tax=Halolamina sp. CBA1230 TaxID=1853690 RepID=UPI0009A19B92|nr:hypothetical protein [Halolamina sp. CBA1230]QKY20597.1 hypothetical protein B4589_009485 [Halolamina sp. CBA1230]